ncbi:MAG TPA: DUF4394 domain-containing protein [Solimonas sp.]|nr:DUF4394 domain-containing protein [Solimonas sp.]
MRRHTLPFALCAVALAAGLTACSDDDTAFVSTPGDTFAVTSANRVVSFDLAQRSLRTALAITGLQTGETVVGVDRRPNGGGLIALGSTGRLYSLDGSTGAATLIAALTADPTDASAPFTALDGTAFGIDFNPVVDRLRVISNTGQNLRINVANGQTITDGALSVTGTVGTATGLSATAYTNAFADACRTGHFFLDTSGSTDRLLVATNSNAGTLNAVGALGVDASEVNGFDVRTAADGTNTLVAALTVGGAVQILTIDPAAGTATTLGALSGLPAGETLRGLAVASLATAPAQAPGELLGLTADNRLVTFNAASPQKLCTTGPVVTPPTGETLQGFDQRPDTGEFIALTTSGTTGKLYAMDAATGALTAKSTLSAATNGTAFGIDFNPAVDRLRVVSNNGQNLRINVDSGATLVDGVLNGDATAATAAGYTNSIGGFAAAAPGVISTTLFVLDPATDALYRQDPPNNGTLVRIANLTANGAALTVDDITAFDINPRTGVAVAAMTPTGATTSDLFTIDLATGVATRANTVGGGQALKGLAFRAEARGDLLALTTDNRVTLVPVSAPGTAAAPVAVTGLGAGETLVGLDFRPATGTVVALSSASKLYTLSFDGTTATAANPVNLSTTLSGAAFGVDFNPVPDRLRVVSTTEQNLRINVATGATTVDGTLTPDSTVFGAAYTQNFSGATATTLFYLDAGSDQLLTTADPNAGALSVVGALGLNVDAEGDFDIVGGQNGLVFGAVQPNGTTASSLVRVNLQTGAATTLGAIGDSSYVVRSVTIRVR